MEGEEVLEPSRDHWMHDEGVKECLWPGCGKKFGMVTRKHHCRKCGKIYCGEHSKHKMKLSPECEFSPDGVNVRVCNKCHSEGVALLKTRGVPRTDHWVEAPSCMHPLCSKEFNLVTRKHHCRKCGRVYCGSHAHQFLPLDARAEWSHEGLPVRVCVECYREGVAHLGSAGREPARDHWIPDNQVSSCMYDNCSKNFGPLLKKHHCRRCGKIYCGEHSDFRRPLNVQAQFDNDGVMCRVCITCNQEGGSYGVEGITREHWRPDDEVQSCQHPPCSKDFSLVERKSHCRRCGDIFCQEHTSLIRPLNNDAELDLRGTAAKVCPRCYEETRAPQEVGHVRDRTKLFREFRSGNTAGDSRAERRAISNLSKITQARKKAAEDATGLESLVGAFTTAFSATEEYERSLVEWMPDEAVVKCPICGNDFGIFNRRHHCRLCGKIVDSECTIDASLETSPINPNGFTEEDEQSVNVCLDCAKLLERAETRAMVASLGDRARAHPLTPLYRKVIAVWLSLDRTLPELELAVEDLEPDSAFKAKRMRAAAMRAQRAREATSGLAAPKSATEGAGRSAAATTRKSGSKRRDPAKTPGAPKGKRGGSSTRRKGSSRKAAGSTKDAGVVPTASVEELSAKATTLFTEYQALIRGVAALKARNQTELRLLTNVRSALVEHLQEAMVLFKKLLRAADDAKLRIKERKEAEKKERAALEAKVAAQKKSPNVPSPPGGAAPVVPPSPGS